MSSAFADSLRDMSLEVDEVSWRGPASALLRSSRLRLSRCVLARHTHRRSQLINVARLDFESIFNYVWTGSAAIFLFCACFRPLPRS